MLDNFGFLPIYLQELRLACAFVSQTTLQNMPHLSENRSLRDTCAPVPPLPHLSSGAHIVVRDVQHQIAILHSAFRGDLAVIIPSVARPLRSTAMAKRMACRNGSRNMPR
jgi:hypothetical protein